MNPFVNITDQQIRERIGAMLGVTHDGTRDTYSVFGYPQTLTPEYLQGLYDRNDIANRIVVAYPKATWRDHPKIRDEEGDSVEDGENFSAFAKSVEDFFEDNSIIRVLERADRLASIGRYGVLYLGFADGERPNRPLRPGKQKLLYVSPYSEVNAKVLTWETNSKSPRYGMPVTYELNNSDLQTYGSKTPRKTLTVHYTRVIHISEFIDQDDFFGKSRLAPLVNRLIDLEKVVGGSAETFWLTANRGLALWVDKDSVISPEDKTKLKDQADEFTNKLRRTMVGQGVSAQVLGSESPDPGPNATVLLDLIAGASGIPKRILLGTERGELASSQDENNWAARIEERRTNYAAPMIVRKFVLKMIETGNVQPPKGKWWVEWAGEESLGPSAEADIALKRSQAIQTYVSNPDAMLVVPPQEFRKTIMGLEPESEYELPAIEDIDEEVVDDPENGQTPTDTDEQQQTPTDLNEEEAANLDDEEEGKEKVIKARQMYRNMKPKPLYVRRDVLNAAAIKSWAKSQGIDLVDDLHVTVCYSKASVDWLKASRDWQEDANGEIMVHPGGPRVLEIFGTCLVLSFVHDGLSWRHRDLKQIGASHDYPKYQPHVTLIKQAEGMTKEAIAAIEPYRGAIALGPEIFEDVEM